MGLQVFIAYLIDLLVGDPRCIPHPVILTGRLISWLEKTFRKRVYSRRGLYCAGILVVVITVGLTYALASALLYLLYLVHPFIAYAAGAWLISTTIAARGLAGAARGIRSALARDNLHRARQQAGMVVGRDSTVMERKDICRAAIETVAENTVDALVAPLFYGFILGPAGALSYRAVNTLDSMLGYKDENYKYLGWAAAKLDDIANYIPARLAGVFMLAAVFITGRNTKEGARSLLKYASRHPSPNAGIVESITAGSLEIRLGGLNYYGGQASFRAYLGRGGRMIQSTQIQAVTDLMYLTSFLFVLSGLLIHVLLRM